MGKKARRRKLLALAESNRQITIPKETKMSNTVTVAAQSEVMQLKQLGVVMSCVLKHKVVATSHKLTWAGGKLNPVWPDILAFFKWTFETTRSESQVRLFVNRGTGEWKAWAFPQKAKQHMNAYEITETDGDDYNKTKEQRAQFDDTLGWSYWGTVHHHCSAGAFQSGTDTANEQNQEGIHITVGHLDKDHYDVHFRLYMNGIKLEGFDLCDFWDISAQVALVPVGMKSLMKDGWQQAIAKHMMGVPPPPTHEFPAIWKDNVIDVTPKAVVSVPREHGVWQPEFPSWNQPHWRSILHRSNSEYVIDRQKAYSEVRQMMAHPQSEFKDMKEMLKSLDYMTTVFNDGELELIDICMRNDLKPEQLMKYIVEQLIAQEKRDEERAKEKAERADKTTNGVTVTTKPMTKAAAKLKVVDAETLADERERAIREYYEGQMGGAYGMD